MMPQDRSSLFDQLAQAYRQHSPRSATIHERARNTLVDGGSHSLRLIRPFPPRIAAARGATVQDEDGHQILDFWQGHYANILGHNPPLVTSALVDALDSGLGLQTGFTESLEIEVAEILCRQTGADRVRFTTSGCLATMYAIMLARAFTQRDLVLKVGGGWHGGQPWALKGVHFGAERGYDEVESQGLPSHVAEEVVVTRFNDTERLSDDFRRYGDRLACFIVEPIVGAGGFVPATGEYLRTSRQLTRQYGAVLILDEIISGFRFCAGSAGRVAGVEPDLTTLGKVIGGGMPVAAVAGRAEIMALVERQRANRVNFTGGTYSAHPGSMLAAKTVLSHLVEHETEIYPRLGELGAKARHAMEHAFAQEGIYVRCTGYPNDVISASSLAMLNFPLAEPCELTSPEDVNDPARCDTTLRDDILQIAMLLEDVHVVHGLGALSTAHSEADISTLREACRHAACRIRPYL